MCCRGKVGQHQWSLGPCLLSVCLSHDLTNYFDIVQHLKVSSGWLPLASVEGENLVRREFATSNLAAPGTKITSPGKRITAPGDL